MIEVGDKIKSTLFPEGSDYGVVWGKTTDCRTGGETVNVFWFRDGNVFARNYNINVKIVEQFSVVIGHI